MEEILNAPREVILAAVGIGIALVLLGRRLLGSSDPVYWTRHVESENPAAA